MQLLILFNNRSQELHVIKSHVHQAVVILSGKTNKAMRQSYVCVAHRLT